ncbi:MAG: hypothetical protein K9J79_07680 [Desulfobacteraceae bacterium]|nr:hypothetical protein [Desulfobacteraceae bacterium]
MTDLGTKLELIYRLRGEKVGSAIDELKGLEKTDRQSVVSYKEEKLRRLMDFAEKECQFYRAAAENTKPASNSTSAFEKLNRLPATDKWIIKKHLPDFICARMRASWRSTSGTTGTPFVFKKDRHASAYMDAMMYCAYNWHGIAPWSRQARIWGSSVGIRGKLVQKAKDRLLGRRRLSAFEMDAHNCRRFFYLLLRHRPFYFYCYPNAMYQFVLSLERLGLDGRQIGAAVVICTGEVLFPHQKEKIEQVTGCRVVNEYGSTENGIIAFECEYGTMHVLPTVHVDIIDPDSDGFGEISVTELNSRSVPFINYKIGDMGRVLDSGCKCGRPFEAFEIKEGRVNDLIVCPSGKKVYAAILAYVLKGHTAQFKVFQEKRDLINIYIVPETDYNPQIEKKIRMKLQNYLGNKMNIKFTPVDNIAPENSGKRRYFVSRII